MGRGGERKYEMAVGVDQEALDCVDNATKAEYDGPRERRT